jgi:hypothetical protein
MTPETRDEMTDFGASFAQALPRVDHEIGTAALFTIAHLRGEDRDEFFVAHSRPGEHAAALGVRGGRHDDGGIDVRMAAAFEKKRNVERDDRRAVLSRLGQERLLRLPHHGMHDAFKTAACFGVAEDGGAEFRTVDAPGAGCSRECRLNREERRAAGALQTVHLCIGIEDGHASAPQHRRDRRLSHAD